MTQTSKDYKKRRKMDKSKMLERGKRMQRVSRKIDKMLSLGILIIGAAIIISEAMDEYKRKHPASECLKK